MALDRLLEGWADAPAVDVEALTLDSREVREGTAFVALAGATTHGLAHARRALEQGAVAVLFEAPAPANIDVPADAIAVPGLRRNLGAMADRFYASPSETLRVIGVTGTNGKTSTVQLVTQALHRAGEVSGSIGTLGAGLHGRIVEGQRTTPDVIRVHALLAAMRDEGARNVAMEVSSHALDQGRVDGVRFSIGVFTNLTRDHLDYHGTMEAYGAAKARLFGWPGLEAAVVNLDDEFGRTLFAAIPHGVNRIGVSSRGAADLWADRVTLGAQGIAFDLVEGVERQPVRSALLGRFNVDNLLAVAGVLRAIGWPLREIADALEELDPVPGRMARLGGDSETPLVVVDYAHTPDALEQALASLRGHTAGRLVCVFGCGGERDRGKRPLMAAIAERAADVAIVTDDNPRAEDGDAIVAQILAGFRSGAPIVERDRARAIARAIEAARPGDTVLIAGKGHEPYQEVKGVRHSFDDLDVARRALAAAGGGA